MSILDTTEKIKTINNTIELISSLDEKNQEQWLSYFFESLESKCGEQILDIIYMAITNRKKAELW